MKRLVNNGALVHALFINEKQGSGQMVSFQLV